MTVFHGVKEGLFVREAPYLCCNPVEGRKSICVAFLLPNVVLKASNTSSQSGSMRRVPATTDRPGVGHRDLVEPLAYGGKGRQTLTFE